MFRIRHSPIHIANEALRRPARNASQASPARNASHNDAGGLLA